MENNAILVGINGFLKGNEKSIISYPPFIKCRNRERYASVLKLGWDCESGTNLVWISSKEEIQRVGILFDFRQEILINNNQWVVLIGPDFLENFKIMDNPHILNLLAAAVPVQGEFIIQCFDLSHYHSFLEMLADTSKRAFDEEIGRLTPDSRKISAVCKAALEIMVRNIKTKSEDRYVAKLATAMVEKNTRAFREYLEFAVIEYEEAGFSRDVIKDWVKQYFQITNKSVYRSLYQPTYGKFPSRLSPLPSH